MRKIYDREHMKVMSRFYAAIEHPDWSDEEKTALGNSEEHIQETIFWTTTEDLRDRLIIEYDGWLSETSAW
jgi:hypothetical protein